MTTNGTGGLATHVVGNGNSQGFSRRSNTTEDPKPSGTISHLLEQIGILKTKNQDLLAENQKIIRQYESKLAEKDQQLTSLSTVNANVREESDKCTTQKYSFKSNGVDIEVVRLQRKLKDLEFDYMEEKKRRTFELEQTKQELTQCRKALSDQKASSAALQKQLDAAGCRVKEMKKTMSIDQTEIKTLKSKLQGADQDRLKAQTRNQDMDQLKNTIRQLETKHKAEIQALTVKLEEDAKKHALQIRERDASQNKLRGQLQTTEQQLTSLRQEVELKTENKQELKADLKAAQEELHNLRCLISRITEAYSELANNTTPLDRYNQLEHAYLTVRFRLIRAERRLADREMVIEHLADICKESSEEKLAMKKVIEDLESAQQEHLDLSEILVEAKEMILAIETANVLIVNLQEQNSLQRSEIEVLVRLRELYREHGNMLFDAYVISDIEASRLSTLRDLFIAQHTRVSQDMTERDTENNRMTKELSLMSKQIVEGEVKCASLNAQLTKRQEELAVLETTSKKHLQEVQRLTLTLYQSQKNELHLEEDIARLSEELENALRYKEAHADLLSEVIALIQRNELAEAEAERLSQFNVEILSHKNPLQKIFYIDRIRSELTETKHELLRSTREREVLAATTTSLQNELAAYKSITVPIDHKPIGGRVRVERVGLNCLDTNRLSPS